MNSGNAGERASGQRARVVIIGGGFAGLYAARTLQKAPVDITLVDRRNHHLFQPLLYQVATAALDPSQIAQPIRHIVRKQKNIEVLLADVTDLDGPGRRVIHDGGELAFDYLLLATGSTHSYFGHDDWAAHAPGLKTVEDALEIRRRVLLAFEAAERDPSPDRRQAWLTFVIVGAGPTGVELAGALAEISRHILAKDFRHLGASAARVLLIEAGPRVLSSFPEALSARSQRDLEQLGVEVRTGAMVTGIDVDGVTLGSARVASRNVIWAAGVAASPLARALHGELDKAGRVVVAPDLSVPGLPHVFVAGDLAAVRDGKGKPVPGVAPAAMQEGRHAAQNIVRMVQGKATRPFAYFDKGSLATIGRAKAVADLGKVRLSGFLAWAAWLVIHIAYLIGFRNRLFVLVSWAWTYLTYQRGSRLITGDVGPLLHPGSGSATQRQPTPARSAPAAPR
jgi:NADH dehydrogenase